MIQDHGKSRATARATAWGAALSAIAIGLCAAAPAKAIELREAVQAALMSNPAINQAVQNKEAIEFERKQAQGLYLPRISIEGSVGIRHLDSPVRRALTRDDDALYPSGADLVAEQVVFDSGRRSAELKRQAARTDGAALRTLERSETVALNVTRQYLDYLLQEKILAASDENVAFHEKLTGDLKEGVNTGSISIADQQQAEERLQAARARRTEAAEDLANAAISFRTLTGLSLDTATPPPSLASNVPVTLEEALERARTRNPGVREAMADVDASLQVVAAARAEQGPRLSLEARGRIGHDIDGTDGRTTDVQGRAVLRWNIFSGGITGANVQEQIRRSSETRYRLHEIQRRAEEEVRGSWNRRENQAKLLADLEQQSRVTDDLLLSYREQFNVGRRSLLDVLDAQNTRYNVQIRRETARLATNFAEYRILAAANLLLTSLDVTTSGGTNAYARDRFKVGPTPPAELDARRLPD